MPLEPHEETVRRLTDKITSLQAQLIANGQSLSFEKNLEQLLNKFSQENGSNTPDFILARYLMACLEAFNSAVLRRESWYGRDSRSFAESNQRRLLIEERKQELLDAHRNWHETVGCPGRPECPVCAAEEWFETYKDSCPTCEHGVMEGDWCEPCNREMKSARRDLENATGENQ